MMRLRWYIWILALCGSGLLGFGLATLALGFDWLEPPRPPASEPGSELPPDLAENPEVNGAREPGNQVAAKKALSTKKGQKAPPTQKAQKAPSTPNAKEVVAESESDAGPIVIGTVVASDPRWSSASISFYGETVVLRLGEELPDGSRLVQIRLDRVVLSRNGQIEVLHLTERPRVPEIGAGEDIVQEDGGEDAGGADDSAQDGGSEEDGNGASPEEGPGGEQ